MRDDIFLNSCNWIHEKGPLHQKFNSDIFQTTNRENKVILGTMQVLTNLELTAMHAISLELTSIPEL